MKSQKWKTAGKILVVTLMITIGIVTVSANEKAVASEVSLSKGLSATLTLNNCTYSYYYGTARPTTSPSSDAYFNWTMKATDVTAATIAAGYIRNMSTTRYSSTSSYRYAVNGTYKFIYKINNSSYNGTIQATNSTTTTVL